METPLAAPDAPSIPRLPALVLIGLLVGPFLSMVDSSVVNVALVTIAHGLNTDLATAQWVVSGYLLALALSLPSSAFLAKRFGTRRIYMLSIMGFTIASLGCAFAPTITVLIVTRVVQGFCGAALVPLAMNILLNPNGVAHKGIPLSAGVLLFLAPALGPTIGGLVLRVGAWPVIFLINVPIGLLGLWGAAHISIDLAGRGDRSARFDPLGLFLIGAGLALTLYGTTAGAQTGWLALDVWPFWSGGVALLLIYLLYALIRSRPALDLKLLRHPQSALALFLVSLVAAVMASTLLLTPIYLQQIQGASALVAGLVLLPQGLVTGFGVVLGNTLTNKWGIRGCILLGMIILTLSTASLLFWNLTTPAWMTALLLSGRGMAIGLTIQPLLTVMLHGLTPQELPDGNTLFTVMDTLSGSVGIALLATFFQSQEVARISAVLVAHGVPVNVLGRLGSGETGIPAALRPLIGAAAIAGLHDTILVMVLVVACGVIATLFVRTPA